jgi:hypothetical protein
MKATLLFAFYLRGCLGLPGSSNKPFALIPGGVPCAALRRRCACSVKQLIERGSFFEMAS